MSSEIGLDAVSSKEIGRDGDMDGSFKGDDETGRAGKREEGLEEQSTNNETQALQQWNNPRINVWRYLVTLLGFVIMGMNDAAIGVSYPYIPIFAGIYLLDVLYKENLELSLSYNIDSKYFTDVFDVGINPICKSPSPTP